MKKTFTFLASCMMLYAVAQEEIIYEVDFEGDLSQWTVDDLDGDGNNWQIVTSSDQAEGQGWGPDGTFMAASFSYSFDPEGFLYPDNILISPSIELPADTSLNLEFLIGTNVDYMNNHNFALYIVSDYTGFDESWEPVYQQNFLGIDTAQQAVLDISDFSGQTVQLVFRHYDSGEQFVLLLDDIVIKESTLGVNDLASNVKLSVYPNPVQDFVNIKVEGNLENVEVFSMDGQLIKSAAVSKINVSELPKGVYVLKIKTENEFFTKKFIKK